MGYLGFARMGNWYVANPCIKGVWGRMFAHARLTFGVVYGKREFQRIGWLPCGNSLYRGLGGLGVLLHPLHIAVRLLEGLDFKRSGSRYAAS